jgi:cytochrome c
MRSLFIMTLAFWILSGEALADGAQLFKDRACWSCHGKDGKTPLLPTYPKIAGQSAQYAEKQLQDIKSGARANANSEAMKGVMPVVSDDEIKELAQYVSKLKP